MMQSSEMSNNGAKSILSGKKSNRNHSRAAVTIIPERLVYTARPIKHEAKMNRLLLITKVIRCFVIVGCTSAFIFYIYNFFNMYWEYQTVVDVSVGFPDEPDLPAVTICNHNVLRKSELKKYNETIYDRIYQLNNRSSILRNTLASLEMEDILRMALNKTDLFYKCNVKSETKERSVSVCRNSVWLYFQKRICFVLNSEWTVHNSQIKLQANDSEFRIVLDLHPKEYFFENTTAAEVYVHSSIALPDSRTSHFPGYGGKSYDIGIQKTTVNLLEEPYQTKCTNYTKRHMYADEDSKIKNLGKRICYQQCLAELANETCSPSCIPECLIFMRNYLGRFNVCTSSATYQEKCCAEIMSRKEICQDRCPLECRVQLYDIQVDSDSGFNSNPESSTEDTDGLYISKSRKYAEVMFNLQMVRHTVYTHNPKITSIEILGYVGGYLGIWLGVSIPLLYDYIVNLALSLKKGLQKQRNFKDLQQIHPSRGSTGDSTKNIRR